MNSKAFHVCGAHLSPIRDDSGRIMFSPGGGLRHHHGSPALDPLRAPKTCTSPRKPAPPERCPAAKAQRNISSSFPTTRMLAAIEGDIVRWPYAKRGGRRTT